MYPNNGKIKKINYGNGFSEEYEYNSLELLDKIWYNYDDGTRVKAYSYTYNDDGALIETVNHLDGTKIVYEYDVQGRFISSSETDASDSSYKNEYTIDSYDAEGRVTSSTDYINYFCLSGLATADFGKLYTYNSNGTLYDERILHVPGDAVLTEYTYDSFNRVTETDRRADNFTYITEYDYFSDGSNTSYLVGGYTSTVNGASSTYTYDYDSKGNITQISKGSIATNYAYDDLGQLTTERPANGSGLTYYYSYDNAGNLTQKTTVMTVLNQSTYQTTSLGYSSSEWGDLLTSYAGTAITYDEIGNPLSYFNGSAYTFTWTGRQLTSAVKGTTNMSFTYNDDGIRTSKTVNGVKHTYYLNGSLIAAEQWSNKLLVYLYDSTGMPIGMMYRTTSYAVDEWDVFWFEKNLQGERVKND